MAIHVFVVCATCREALALEWDSSSFLVGDPLGGQGVIEGEAAEAALLYGAWPPGSSAPTPLAAGTWAALATRAAGFVHRHLAHPDSAGMFIAREQPDRATLVPAEPFTLPVPSPSAPAAGAHALEGVRGLTVEKRLELAAELSTASMWDLTMSAGARDPEGLLLAGWLPADAHADERLLALILDDTVGPVAEETLAVRIVLGVADPGRRRQRLLAVAEAAYARRTVFSARVRTTPYDDAAPIAELQAGAVERLTAAGRIDQACRLATRCAVPETRLGILREALARRILDRAVPADERLRLAGRAKTVFPNLLSELRRERGLACDQLPTAPTWSALAGPARTMASLTAAPAAVRSALTAAEVPTVVVALDVTKELASVIPEEAVGFIAEVGTLCRDGRTEPRPIQTRLCARARDVHSLLFAALGGAGAWEALTEVIDAMLSTGLGASMGLHFRALGANSIPVERVGTLLVQRVADRTRPVKERIQAREALSVLAAEGSAVRRNQPLPSPEGQAAACQADDLLIVALNDPAEADELKSAIRSALTRWMPDRIPELQGSVVERVPVPSITTLQPGRSLAEFDKSEIIALLRDTNADLGRVLAAIALAEPLARMAPQSAVELESLLRARMADSRRYTDRARSLTVAVEAWHAHRAIWQQLRPGERPGGPDLLSALRRIAAAQEAPGSGERSHTAALVETVAACLAPADRETVAAGLESTIADRRSRAWTRLHAYHALVMLSGHGTRADRVLFAALADPSEDALLRTEAHPLLAPHLAQPVYELQARGVLPRPSIPPVDTLFHNLPLYERDTDGEWVLTPDALRLGNLVYPDDLIAALRDPIMDPARACAAAALAAQVARRLPAHAAQLVDALRGGHGSVVEFHAEIAGRARTFRLAELCTEGLHAIGSVI